MLKKVVVIGPNLLGNQFCVKNCPSITIQYGAPNTPGKYLFVLGREYNFDDLLSLRRSSWSWLKIYSRRH